MGLPEINIEFKGKAVTAVQRSQLGIVALILKDDVGNFDTKIYKGIEEIEASDWTPEVLDYIQKTFKGTPSKVICERLASDVTDYNEALKRLNNKRFNYLAIPQIDGKDTSLISTWIKTKRENNKKTFKAVLPNEKADHEGVINFTTSGIKVGEKEYKTAEYTARIAGILAGLPFTRSSTYYELNEIDSITEIDDPDAAVDNGELILINDGEKIKIGRGVNSLTTTTTSKTEDFKSIRVVEVMDLIKDDIRTTYNDHYVGKVNNIYDNQVLFFRSINAYFTDLSGNELLDPNFANKADINVNAQRLAWEGIGTDTSSWDDQMVKERSFKKNVFAAANIKIVDTMEDLDFDIAI
ncbi:phage tail sheath C-terminal domain-containing protein [Heyndrickxia oleronia]|uniref:phage tail sheath C-terminal domain-containing protein n=1 Tax=Heyndrickxia oleronia TaxID=38875 RepID=UPI00242A6FFF|nr:phage tail sheath C-terminal domain-containing protein [Heyndrickxia oleronia]MCI1592486.1 phage tail sheath subtilisin-like domain-containing protein [Heyndrickxia oleronia]MCI1615447.1 phage tail sheath subtilisin-like domain-containing protein [Heyndrickxia oleronia]MCI1746301.1 phage tail sheath subtilisin-like domain-containing protein [Heyndrickxia oleronia]MCI1763586.1 phage tail sheath subtilisin-like domain-containing protein [Heyndrickxia oleronia]